ncbi:pyridoxamine 5'-phosphate oxidase family protein [Corynebacterium felinum]|uniref:Nitroimidazol reductase NimA-like FMN-containing flavoprotein (Pyridoxamine 5'-phosphate oxidase superfamily) n=1 Tax=Corynebacterium felinum TaxID=131318 RepID=A0ABU2B503_9CORY|nr:MULTISPECIES: pyridoxamine 5'-phosphate oxidase family protein [Corynebacterium]MDF5820326.1 pyridoxamine 5'-phosphate oxidase family protein [Corynebacterium felinum]MDO4762139.1 pyridoxamine 5'-phosphate oxidase family protein [Corynebacterium sp.]MDR7353693.1 nitroimidazol reductase NimA-like FMN-containing flavoprotein (pyridoxamine 5'-phosphate oxidase superfamily) [Corynebacterium felinum]WJY95872.1 Pyridoxamine 5'-phosphate oxidase [Corynebacterium felinum]
MEKPIITVLTKAECLEKIASVTLGRLVVRRKDDMDIFPINFVLDGEKIYFRTAEGYKLFSVALNNDVLFEVDEAKEDSAWSVVVRGTASLVQDIWEIQHADRLPLKPWVPTLKHNYVRIDFNEMSGRAFVLGDEPDRY